MHLILKDKIRIKPEVEPSTSGFRQVGLSSLQMLKPNFPAVMSRSAPRAPRVAGRMLPALRPCEPVEPARGQQFPMCLSQGLLNGEKVKEMIS